MKKKFSTINLRFKLILTYFITIAAVGLFISVVSYFTISRLLFDDLRARISHIAILSSDFLDKEALGRLVALVAPGLPQEAVSRVHHSADFRLISDELNRIRESEKKLIRYVYIVIPTADANKARFIVDADLLPSLSLMDAGDAAGNQIGRFSEELDISGFQVMREALKAKTSLVEKEYFFDAAQRIYSVSAYAPVADERGEFIALLGIDTGSEDVQNVLGSVSLIFSFIITAALAVSLISAFLLGTMYTKGITHLEKIINRFGNRELDARARITTRDEVGQLGESFNVMADTIQNYSAKLEALLNAFGHFVPHEFLDRLDRGGILEVRTGDQVRRKMALLFLEIRHFPYFSGSMNAEECFAFLNSFLVRMAPVIQGHNGFIVRHMGDSFLCLLPGAADAVKAAAGIFTRLAEYNEERKNLVRKAVEIGVGIHKGDLLIGVIGEGERMEGVVVSDAMDLLFRLKGMIRKFDVNLAVSVEALNELGEIDKRDHRILDRTRGGWKNGSIPIYEMFFADPQILRLGKIDSREAYDHALRLYYERRFTEALTAFGDLSKAYPEDRIFSIYLDRCRFLLQMDPGPDWDGSFEAYG
jgi:class 3 adenylate cyclase/HAMP domain-containing protein